MKPTPVTEYEWDVYVRNEGPGSPFAHCYWLATNYPAKRPRKVSNKGKPKVKGSSK